MAFAFPGFQVATETVFATVDGAAPAAKGTDLEGLKYLYGTTIWGHHRPLSVINHPTVSERVTSSVALEVAPSSIANGDGVFVKGDVAAGDLIFNTKKPLLNIVNF